MAWRTNLGLPLSFLCVAFVRIVQMLCLSLRSGR